MRTAKRAKSISFGKKKEAPVSEVEKEVKKATAHHGDEKEKAAKVEEKKHEVKEVAPKPKEKETPEIKEDKQETASSAAEAEIKKEATLNIAEKEKEEETKIEKSEDAGGQNESKEPDEPEHKGDEPKGEDSLEKDLEKLKEPEESASVQTNPSTNSEVKTEETKQEEEPFTVKSAFSTTDGLYDRKKKSALPFFFLVASVSFVLGLAVMAGASYLMKGDLKLPAVSNLAAKPSPTPAPTEAPTLPTETPKKVDVSAVTIKMLNGSGVAGEAAKVKRDLVAAGFTVSSTGNADTSTYKKTEIIAKKSVDKEVLTKLEDELSKTFIVASPTEPTGTQATDIIVIIGSSTK